MKKLLLSAILIATSTVVSAQTTLKFSHVVADDTPKGQIALKFKALIEERSNGEFIIDVFPNSQLYDDTRVLEGLLLGDVHFAAPSLSKLGKLTKKLQLFDLPFLFKDMQAVERFQQSKEGQGLLKSFEKKGLVGLGYAHNGLKQFSSNFPIHLPSDIKGKKFRIQASDVLAKQFQQVGAIPLKKPFSETFTLLQTKAIDGQEGTWSNTYTQKFYEIQSHITTSNHGLIDYMVLTSTAFWHSLSEKQQTMFANAMKEAIAYGNALAATINNRDYKLIADSGYTNIIELTPDERKQWVDAMQPVWKRFEKQIGKNLIDAAKASNYAD